MVVVGIEKVDYVSKKTGKRVIGIKLHLTEEKPDNQNLQGSLAESVYIPANVDCDVKLGQNVEIFYDKYGHVTSVF